MRKPPFTGIALATGCISLFLFIRGLAQLLQDFSISDKDLEFLDEHQINPYG